MKNQDWFDENNMEIQELLMKKNSIHEVQFAQLSFPRKKAALRFVYRDF